MQAVIRFYQFLNILSLDVAAGAVICAAFFARIFEVTILFYGLLSLGLTVWIIYTADHLLDAYKTQKIASTNRHRFHQKYFKILLIIVLVAALADGAQLFYIRRSVFIGGLLLACIVVIYFIVQRRLKFLKEIFGAVLYTGGVLLIPVSLKDEALTVPQVIFIGQLFLTAITNLFLFSWFDQAPDERDNHQSFTTVFGEGATQNAIIFMVSLNAILEIVQLSLTKFLFAEMIMILMNVILFVIFRNRKYFEMHDRYRLVGDAIFLFPLMYILV